MTPDADRRLDVSTVEPPVRAFDSETRILVIGVSHRTAGRDQGETAILSDGAARAVLRDLTRHADVAEAVALSTGGRTELYAVAGDVAAAEAALEAALVAHGTVGPDELGGARYRLRDEGAAGQLFRLAWGLDWMAVAESAIQDQLLAAWTRAREEGAVGPLLDRLFRQALEVGGLVRASRRIGTGSASVSSVAVELARGVLADLTERRALVVGAGRMAAASATALARAGVRDLVVADSGAGAARELARRVGGRGVGLEHLGAELEHADVVISSTDAPHPVLRRDEVAAAVARRDGRPLVMVDLSVPRDLEGAIGALPGVALYDIDDVERVVEASLDGRHDEISRREGHVVGAVRGFAAWRDGQAAAPSITRLRELAEAIRAERLERLEGRWDSLSPADRERVEALTKAIVTRLLHEPTVRVRAAAQEGDARRHLDSLDYLFGLDPVARAAG